MKDTDLAWLAGIWDGEGSVMLYSRPVRESKLQITPALEVTNTDIHIMNKVREILENLGCNFSYTERTPGKSHHKVAFSLRTQNAKYIKTTLEAMLPYLIGNKKAYGETLLSFVSKRLLKADAAGKPLKHTPYDEEDYEFVRSSTTTREAHLGVKI